MIGTRLDAAMTTRLAASAVPDIADAVWDEAMATHTGAGSAGNALAVAGSSGDPWSTIIPGAYGANTAGNIVGNRLDVAVGSRPSAAAIADAVWDEATSGHVAAGSAGKALVDASAGGSVSTAITAIKDKTDKMVFDPENNLAAHVKKINERPVVGRGISADKFRGG
jgi:hypothetical protein